MKKQCISVSEAAKRLGVSRQTFYKLLESVHGPLYAKLDRRIVIPEADFEQWLERRIELTCRHRRPTIDGETLEDIGMCEEPV